MVPILVNLMVLTSSNPVKVNGTLTSSQSKASSSSSVSSSISSDCFLYIIVYSSSSGESGIEIILIPLLYWIVGNIWSFSLL